MQPLLKIQTVPIKIEAQTKRASFKEVSDPVPVARSRGGYRPQPIKAPAPQQQQVVNNNSQRVAPDYSRASTAAAQNVQKDNYLQDASNAIKAFNQGSTVQDVSASEFTPDIPTPIDFEPQAPIAVSGGGSTSFDYQMDRATFDWNANQKPQLEYVPPSIEYSVTQYPDVIIEYVGEPIYVPASSNPNYVPPPGEK